MRTIVVAVVAIVAVSTSACDKIGIGPSGTCVDESSSYGACIVNAKDFVCNSSGSTQKKQFFKEDGTAGLVRCKSLGFDLPRDPAKRRKAEDDLKADNMVHLHKRP